MNADSTQTDDKAMAMAMAAAVEEIIRAQFHLPASFALDDAMGPGDIPGWDSLNWIELLSAIEEHFAIELNLDQAADLDTIGRIKQACTQ